MWRIVVWLAIGFIPISASAQDKPLPFTNDELAGYTIPSCRTIGCDRQVVEPNAALTRFGRAYGPAGDWRSRVRQDPSYASDGQADTTCSGAVNALFKLVCGSNTNCEIEASYDAKCLSPSTDNKTAQACVDVANTYVRQCFGNGCPTPRDRSIMGGYLTNASEAGFCSGSGLRIARSAHSVEPKDNIVVTVDHCEPKISDGTSIVRQDDIADKIQGSVDHNIRDLLMPGIRAYRVTGRVMYPLVPHPPALFEQTYFQGFNSIIYSANLILAKGRAQGKKYSPLYCDGSPLCTVTENDQGKLMHTCQSTKRGSGGALFQMRNGMPVLVGVNNGSPSKGNVDGNDGITILR